MGETDASWDPMSEAFQSPVFNLYGPKFPSKQSGEENLCLFVSGFPSTVTNHAVRNLLSQAGQIQFVKTVPDRKRWNCVVAYVYAATYKDALAIIGGFNNFSFLNSTLRIGFTTKKKPLTDPASQSNVGSAVEARFKGSLSGLNQTLSDVESLGARPGKTDVMDFQRWGSQQPQQKPPMGRSKLLMTFTSQEAKATIGHEVGRRNSSQPLIGADRCSTLTDDTSAAATADGDELKNKHFDQLKQSSSDVRRNGEENNTKTGGDSSVSSNEHQMDVASVSSYGSVSSVKKCTELCAFCLTPGQLFCSVCKTTYCSQTCQRNDWSHHKNVCQSKPSKSDSSLNFANFDNEFAVGVDVDELSSSLLQESNLPDSKKFAVASTNVKVTESSLPIDAFIGVILATVPVSPSDIWVVEEKNSQLMDSLKRNLQKRYSGRHAKRSSAGQLMLSDYCVCLFSLDGCWYRSRIESVNRDGTFDVRYIDYGNVETVSSSEIDVLDEEFCSVPSMAVRCRLDDLVPADGSGVWSKRALKLCSELLPILEVLRVKCIKKTANVHSIVLVDAAGRHISDEFIEAGVAKHLFKSAEVSLDQSNHEKAQEERTSPTSSKDDQLRVSLSPLTLSPSQSEVVKEIVANSPHGMPTAAKHLFRGAKVLVKVLNIVSPTQFWVHLLSGSSDLEKLPDLEASMKEHYGKKPSQKGFSLTVRMLYAARCSTSERWMRVHVLNFDRSAVDAFLLDYGVCQTMSLVSLLSLEGQFCSLPFQAVQCTLAGIRPKDGSKVWTQGTVNYLQRLISQTTNAEQLEAAVCQVDGSCVHLELMLPSGVTVNNLLVKYGMAEFLPDLQPGFFVLSRNLIAGGKAISEEKTSRMSPLNLHIGPADESSSGRLVEGLLKKRDTPPVHLPTSSTALKLKDLMRNPLARDKIHEVIVTDATHFFGFYVQVVTVERAKLLESLEERLNEIYCDYRGSFHPCVGDIVAARFSVDRKWYRGLVREVTSSDSALVMFLDYGNCDNVDTRFIGPLDASLLTVPVFAYRCTLLEPTGVIFVQPWNPDFLLPLSATFQMKVLKELENVHVVDLFSKDHGVSWKDKLLRDGVIQLKSTSTVDASKPHSSSSAGHSFSSSLSDKVISSPAGNHPKFQVGSAVCVVHINSVADFYVHVEDKDMEKAFHGLMQRLREECVKCALSSYVPKGPGEVVAALYDHVWYRAKVLQILSSTTCRMEFVDFGNVDVVACNCLRPLPPGCHLDVLAEMAVPCSLFDLDTSPKGGSGDCLDAESSKWFRNLCLEKQFMVTGVCSLVSNRYAVDLRSTEMTSTIRDCYLKMSNDHKVSPLAAGRSLSDKGLVTQVANSPSGEQQQRPPLGSFNQRPSDKRVRFANDVKFNPRAQTSGNQFRPTGSMQSGFRSTANNQSEFRSKSSQQFGSKSVGNHQSEPRSTGSNWQGQDRNMINGTTSRSIQNNWPQLTENKQPEPKVREDSLSVGPKVAESHQTDPVITEKKCSGSAVNDQGQISTENVESGSKVTASNQLAPKLTEIVKTPAESFDNLSDKLHVQQSAITEDPLPKAVAMEADLMSSTVAEETEKSKHLELLRKSNEVVASKSSSCRKLLVVDQTVSIVHINSPSDFYVQLFDDESREQNVKFLGEFHQSAHALDSTPYSNGRVGDSVAGLFDDCWFRADVVQLLPGDRARLFFVDYGNVSVVENRNIRSTMPKSLLSRPRLAIHCAIEGLVGNETNGDWGEDAIAWFRQRFENATCKVKLVIASEGNELCNVDLVGSQAKESIKEQIISNRFGQTVSPRQAENTIRLETEFKPKLALAASNGDGKVLGQVVKVNDDVIDLPQRDILSPPPLPFNAKVKVIHANGPSEFFVQSADESVQLSIAQLCLDLTTHCSSTHDTCRPSAVGECVAGLFEGMWFRAQVLTILPQDQFKLFFVDFGNVDVIGASDIRVLPENFASLMPKQAIRCGLARLAGTDVAGKWSADSCVWFKAYCENFDFHVQSVMFDEFGKCLIDMVRSGAQHSIREQLLSSCQAVDLANQAKSLRDSGHDLIRAEKQQGGTSATVMPDQAETRPTTAVNAVKASRPMHNANTSDSCSVAQELSGNLLTSVTNQCTLAAIQPPVSASIAASAASLVSSASNQPVTSTDLIKAPVNNTESSVDHHKMAAVKPGSFAIKCGDVVSIVHVNSPSDFYAQLQTDSIQGEFVELLKKLNEWCTSSASGAKPYRPVGVGEIVAANFEGIWYRAEVLDICQDSKAQLRFIDFGNVDVTDFADIRCLPVELINALPRQAMPCAISGVMPVGTDGRWSPEAVHWFRENTENVSSFVVRSSSLTHEGKYSIDICTVLPNGNQELSLCQMLISMKLGRSSEISASANSQSESIRDIKRNGQSDDHSAVAQLSSQSIAQSNDQSGRLSKIKSNAESSGQSTGQLGVETMPVDSVGDRNQREMGCSRSVLKLSDLPELRLSSDVTVEVTLPTNPGSFWCQDLLQMADMVNRVQFQESPPLPVSAGSCPPKIVNEKNDVCLGFHDKYGEWYRVVVKDVQEDRLAVRFMDYGDETTLLFNHVRPLPEELKSFPPLAFHCSLAGIVAAGSDWTEQAKAVFQSLVTSQILTASIQSHDYRADHYKVILKVQSSGQSVGEELVKTGLANRVLKI